MRQDYGAQPLDATLPTRQHPGTANSTIRLESELAYVARSKKLYSLIWTHVEDVDMRARLETVAGDGLAAWTLLEEMANLPTTGLTQVNQDNDWNNLKLSDVGITEATISRFVGHMNRVNADRANPYDDEARRIRLLSVLTFPTLIRDRAATELQRCSCFEIRNGIQVPSLRATIDMFDELWRLMYSRGEIKYVAPPRQESSGGRSVVALSCEEQLGDVPARDEGADGDETQPVRKYQRLSDLPADELDGWTGDPTIDYRYADAYVVTDTVKACTNLLAKSLSNIGRRLMGRRLPAIIDTGATRHVSGIKDYFPDELISDANPRGAVKIADGRALPIRAVGCLVVYVPSVNPKTNAPGIHKLVLSEALYVPGMNETLISPRAAFTLDGTRTYFNDDNYMELKDGTIIPFAAGDKHYHLAISNDFQEEAMSAENGRRQTTRLNTPDLIHSRLSHFSHERIRASAKHTTGVDLEGLGPGNDCDSCVIGGARKAPSPAATTPEEPRYTYFGQKICSDTCAMPKSSPFGFTGMVCFLDMATHYVGLYFIKSHEGGEILSCLKQWMAEHREHLTDKGLVEWRTDNATEFFNSESDNFCKDKGIKHSSITPYNPQANPSERLWGTLLRAIRITLAESNTGEALWPFSAAQAAQVNNALVTRSVHVVSPGETPYNSMVTGRTPDLSRFRTMFCATECLATRFEKDMRKVSKIAPRTIAGIHMGVDRKRSGYFIYVPSWERLTTFRYEEVFFYETEFPTLKRITGHLVLPETRMSLPSEEQQALDYIAARDEERRNVNEQDHTNTADEEEATGAPANNLAGPPSARTRAARLATNNLLEGEMMLVDRIDGVALTVDAEDLEGLPPLPKTFSESQSGEYADEWREAATKEMKAKWANETGVLVPRPERANVVKSKFVPSYKRNDDGSLRERRYRWVGCGYSQKEGIDFHETFTATAKAGSVRFLLGLIASRRMKACTMDIVKAFTTSEVRETIYVEQPEGFIDGGYMKDGKPKMVYLLKKGLEGLKQSGYNFQQDNIKHLVEICGMTQLVTEPCMFTKSQDGKLLVMLCYVDDLLIGYDDEHDLSDFMEKYKTRYNVEQKPLQGFIGMQVTRNLGGSTITLSQEKYLKRMGEKYLGPGDLLRETKLPSACDKKGANSVYSEIGLAATDEERESMKDKPYLSLLATVLYASVMTRPDVAYHVSYLCRFASDPSPACYKALLSVCNYLVTTAGLCLTLGGSEINGVYPESARPPIDNDKLTSGIGLHGWSDGSWKAKANYAGYVVMAFNGPVEWGSKLIKVTMHSSSEIEIAAACLCAKRIMFLREMCNELGVEVKTPIPLLIDNSGAIDLCEKVGVSKRTEHFMRWQHYCRYLTQHFILRLHFVRSHEQVANK